MIGYNLNSGGAIQNPIMVTHQYNSRIILLMIMMIATGTIHVDRRNKGTASDLHFLCERSFRDDLVKTCVSAEPYVEINNRKCPSEAEQRYSLASQ